MFVPSYLMVNPLWSITSEEASEHKRRGHFWKLSITPTIMRSIKGHVSDIFLKELQRLPEGVYSPGDRRLVAYTSHGVKPGGEVKVTEADGTVTRWQVTEEEWTYAVLEKYTGRGKRSFLLKRKI